MFCTECGSALTTGAPKFCANCGAAIPTPPNTGEQAPQAPQPSVPPVAGPSNSPLPKAPVSQPPGNVLMVTCPCGRDYNALLHACPTCRGPRRAARLMTPGLSTEQPPPVASPAQRAVGAWRDAKSATPTRVRPVVVVAIIVVAGIALWGMTQGGDQAPAAKPQANSVTNTKPSTTGSRAIIKSYKVEYRGDGSGYLNAQYWTGTGYAQVNGAQARRYKTSPGSFSLKSGDSPEITLATRTGDSLKCEIWVNGKLLSTNSASGTGSVAYCTVTLP